MTGLNEFDISWRKNVRFVWLGFFVVQLNCEFELKGDGSKLGKQGH